MAASVPSWAAMVQTGFCWRQGQRGMAGRGGCLRLPPLPLPSETPSPLCWALCCSAGLSGSRFCFKAAAFLSLLLPSGRR